MAGASDAASGVTSQTLSRGLRILEILAAGGAAASSAEIAAELGLHRSITYRLLRTLEQHRLVVRDDRGLFALGPRLASLAATVERDLQQAAVPALRSAADELEATCFLVRHDGDEAITLTSVAPRRSLVTVAQHPGTQHPLGIGAPGRAVLYQLPIGQWPEGLSDEQRAATAAVAAEGFAASRDEVIPGLQAVAVPLALQGHPPLAVGVAYLVAARSPLEIAERLRAAAAEIAAALDA
jgi:DNA-binding IclR family transcriptional regulator